MSIVQLSEKLIQSSINPKGVQIILILLVDGLETFELQ